MLIRLNPVVGRLFDVQTDVSSTQLLHPFPRYLLEWWQETLVVGCKQT